MSNAVDAPVAWGRLFLSQSEWEALPERLADPFFQKIAATNRPAIAWVEQQLWGDGPAPAPAEAAADQAFCDKWRYLKSRLLRATVEWYLHKRPEDLELCKHTVDYLLQRPLWTVFWGKAQLKHYGLKMGELTFAATFAYDALGAHLDEPRREGLKRMLTDVALAEYEKGLDAQEWWRHAEFNWGTATHADAGLAALAVEPFAPELSRRVLRKATDGLQYVIEALPAEGGWTEGMMYMTTMLGHLTDFVSASVRVHGDDLGLTRNPRLIASLDYRAYMIGGDSKPLNFSNIGEETTEYRFPGAYWWAQQCGKPEWTWLEDHHVKPPQTGGLWHDVEAFWHREAFQESREPALAPIQHFRGLDWFKWTGKRTWLALRSGFNGGNHNNIDLGHFIFGAGSDRFLCDPGYGAGRTNQHNAVTVRGQSQAVDSEARIFRVRATQGGFYLACDLTSCFSHRLAFHYRHLLLIDESHLLVVDDILGVRGHRVGAGFHLQTHLPHERQGGCITLKGQQHALSIRLLSPVTEVGVEDWEWSDLPVTSFKWGSAVDLPHIRHAMLMSLDPTPFDWRLGDGVAELTIGTRTWRIDLDEGSIEQPE